MAITLGSLFDGIGVFPLAASNYGIVPLWASEIEKVPISITKKHFPQMQHLGDITKLDGAKIPPVHIITFGSPCQNLSTIGAREGLAGAKSGLFHHAIRIIQEMRCATDGKYPVIAVWENVRGAFSSNNGWTLEPCWSRSQIPKFQCLLLEDGQTPEWFEGVKLMCAGDSWTLSIGENPPSLKEENVSSSWRILEDSVPQKYYLNPTNCTHILTLAERAGCPPAKEIEYLLIKQGGKYQSYVPLRKEGPEGVQNIRTRRASSEALDGQMTLFPPY